MKNSTLFKWWFMYALVSFLATFGAAFVFGFFAGMTGLPELVMIILLVPILIYINFSAYSWSVRKALASSTSHS